MKILYTAFNGKNSSKILLDAIDSNHKLYLKNSFNTSVIQLQNELSKNNYDLVVSFGRAPLRVDNVKIEISATNENKYKTNYDYNNLKEFLKNKGYKVIISNSAGKYLCNNLYYHGLKYIDDNKLKTQMIFIHLPKLSRITNISNLIEIFSKYI